MKEPTRLVIADDHPVIRAGLRSLLSMQSDLVVAGEAADGRQAVALWHETRPDVGLFDLRMPVLDGIGALGHIRQREPHAAIVILTTLIDVADMDRAIGAGANAVLPKESSMAEIVACIQTVRHGVPYLHAGVEKRLSDRATEESLTPRETEVLNGIARGWTNQRVADELKIAEGTIKTHLKRIFGKLYAGNRTEAVVIARQRGLLTG